MKLWKALLTLYTKKTLSFLHENEKQAGRTLLPEKRAFLFSLLVFYISLIQLQRRNGGYNILIFFSLNILNIIIKWISSLSQPHKINFEDDVCTCIFYLSHTSKLWDLQQIFVMLSTCFLFMWSVQDNYRASIYFLKGLLTYLAGWL